MDPAVDGEPRVAKLLGRNLDLRHLVHHRGLKEYDAVMAGFDSLIAVGARQLAIADHIVVDQQLAAGESLRLAIEVINVGELSSHRLVHPRVGMDAKEAAVGIRRDLALDLRHSERCHAQAWNHFRHNGANPADHCSREIVRRVENERMPVVFLPVADAGRHEQLFRGEYAIAEPCELVVGKEVVELNQRMPDHGAWRQRR